MQTRVSSAAPVLFCVNCALQSGYGMVMASAIVLQSS